MKRDTKKITLKTQLKKLSNFIAEAGINPQKRARYIRQFERDFTRRRKLHFTTTVVFILGLLKKV